jgi:phage terminase small subunit
MPLVEKKTKLKHGIFIREYLIDGNGTRAAISAGYSAKTAHAAASRLLKNVKVRAEIDRLTDERAKKLDITADRVLRELALLGFSNMEDYIRISSGGTAYVDLSKLTREQAAAIQEITVDEYTEGTNGDARDVRRTKFKLGDKRGSLHLLGKHLKLFTELGSEDSPLNLNVTGIREKLLSKLTR